MKIYLIILTYLTFFLAFDGNSSCPPGSLISSYNGYGNYDIILKLEFFGTGYSSSDIQQVVYNFGDGTGDFTSSSANVNHDYYSFGTYPVTATVTFQTGSCSMELTTSVEYLTNTFPCPLATFLPKRETSCADGSFNVAWTYCDYSAGSQTLYWNMDSILWSFGNGNIYTSYGTNGITTGNSPTFYANTSGSVTITAMAYFTGLNGEKCENSLVWCTTCENTDPCSLSLSDGNTYLNYYTYTPPLAQPNPQPSAEVVCAGTQFTIADFGNLTAVSTSGATYSLTRNDTLVQSGSGIPAGGNAFYTATISITGQYVYELKYTFSRGCSISSSVVVEVVDCEQECSTCNTFKPYPGEDYWVSAWVKENQSSPVKTYSSSKIRITYYTSSGSTYQDFATSGEIIDGWQRIVGKFEIPSGTTDIQIALMNSSGVDAYFDDIRIHPYNASMKSYVYDPETLWLTAELDDNNYATFYEYDKEGQLIRIKKETSRGVMTIQESRSNNPKKE